MILKNYIVTIKSYAASAFALTIGGLWGKGRGNSDGIPGMGLGGSLPPNLKLHANVKLPAETDLAPGKQF